MAEHRTSRRGPRVRRERIAGRAGWLGALAMAAGLTVAADARAQQDAIRRPPGAAIAEAAQPVTRPLPVTDLPAQRALLDAADRLIARGRTTEAEALVAGRSDVVAVVVRARLAERAGRLAEARALLERVAPLDALGEAALDLGLLLQRAGAADAAARWLAPLVAAAQQQPEHGAVLARGARAARALGNHRLATSLYREATRLLPESPAVETAWGELLLEKHNIPDALTSFERALAVEPDYVPALVGLARALAEGNPPQAAVRAARALEIDPGAWRAHLVLADLALDARRVAEARGHVAHALALAPAAPEPLALRAAIAAVEDRLDDFERDAAAVLAQNPRDGSAHRLASAHLAAHYRFEEAVRFARQAVAIDPDDAAARALLGLHLVRVGDEGAARLELEAAFTLDPYDVVTYNLLALLDTLKTFETVRDDPFVFRFHPSEASVLREFALPLAREAVDAMAARWGVRPDGPVLVELFPRHDDFAVRTAGLPGMVGAVGACFGRVVTLDSPRARPPGTFHWGATLWHELAHVITLQLSRQRVPRWLTEGISVHEERLARPQWGREAELDFVQALEAGQVFRLEALNDGFSDPRRIALAYQQASLVVEFLLERHGYARLVRMLRAYGEGLDDAAVIARELGTDLAELQAGFEAFVEARYGAMRRALRLPEGVALEGADADQLARLADEHPGSFPLQMVAARALRAAGQPARALPLLERAAALVPIATGPEGPLMLLAEAALAAGDRERAMRAWDAALDAEHTALEAARRLAEVAAAAGDEARLARAHERIADLVPYEAASHTVLGRQALARGDVGTALRRFRVALAAGPADVVSSRTDLAEALARRGAVAEARRELIAALAEAPLYARAQDLLLAIVEGEPVPAREPRR